jgi:hypothetical protein
MAHFLTNKGKLLLVQGLWDDAGASAVRIGLFQGATFDVDIDTQAEVNDLNTVTDLLAVATELTSGGYARQNLVRTNAAEDDTNDRVNLDAADVVFSTVAVGQTVPGGFWYDATTDTNDTTRLLCGVFSFATPLPTNGSNITLTIADLVRAS